MADFDPVSFALGAASAKGGPGGASTLSGLTDVDISNPTDGQTLVYNATSGKWENGAGGGAMVVPFGFVDETPTLMAKAGDIYDAMARGKHVVVVFSVPNVGVVQAQPLYCVSIESQSMDKLFVLSEPGATILMTANIPIGVYKAETDDDYPTLNGGDS